MRGVKIDLTMCCGHAGRPLVDTWLWAASDTMIEVTGVPSRMAGMIVDGVALELTNANGEVDTFVASGDLDAWNVRVPADFLSTYGFVESGVLVKLLGTYGTERVTMIVAQGNLCIRQTSADIRPGDPTESYVRRGEDVYRKTVVDDEGVQHYTRETLVWSAEMEGWALTWTGDYILENGQFVEVTA